MEDNTYRAVYDNGQIRFIDPVHLEGEWKVTVTFVEEVDAAIPLEADPHRHEQGTWRERMEEAHRQFESDRPRTNPF